MSDDPKFTPAEEKLLLKIKEKWGFETLLVLGVKTNPEDEDTEAVYLINDRTLPEADLIVYMMRGIEVLLESLTDRPKIH